MVDFSPINHIEIIDGQARIGKHRTKVKMVISMLVVAGAPIEDVMEQYNLSRAEVHAALVYYYDNKAAIDQAFAEDEALLRQVGTPLENVIKQMQDNHD
jgi:uncharacterized protein (DUF433 family)